MPVFVTACEREFWQDVLTEVVKLGVDVAHACVHYKSLKQPQYFFQNHNVKLVDGKKFYNLNSLTTLLQESFNGKHIPLDKAIIEYLTPLENDFYILTDRFCYFPLSFRYRKKLFRTAVKFWLTYFTENKVTHFFTTCSPHSFPDYTAYHVAKYLNIPILLLAHTMINDYVILRHDYREIDEVPESYLDGQNVDEIKKIIDPQLYEAAFSESKVLTQVIQENNISQKIGDYRANKFKVLKRSLSRMVDNFGDKTKFKGGIAMNKLDSKWLRRIVRRYDFKWRQKQQKYYESKVSQVNYADKYIYFAMHLQPERTSTPEAGIFEDHLLAISIIAKSLPPGWKLYVKENPRQFDKINSLKAKQHRDYSDYDDILKIPNTYLVSQKTPTPELIKNAQIVATLTGSVGWEALLAHKPVMIFGYSWYEACRASFRISNVAECQEAISAALKLTPEQIKLDNLKYLAYMQSKLIVGNLGEEAYIVNMNLTYEEHVKSVAANMVKEFKQ